MVYLKRNTLWTGWVFLEYERMVNSRKSYQSMSRPSWYLTEQPLSSFLVASVLFLHIGCHCAQGRWFFLPAVWVALSCNVISLPVVNCSGVGLWPVLTKEESLLGKGKERVIREDPHPLHPCFLLLGRITWRNDLWTVTMRGHPRESTNLNIFLVGLIVM